MLKPLNLRTMTKFASLGLFGAALRATIVALGEEVVLKVNVETTVEVLFEETVDGAREVMKPTGDSL